MGACITFRRLGTFCAACITFRNFLIGLEAQGENNDHYIHRPYLSVDAHTCGKPLNYFLFLSFLVFLFGINYV